MTYHHRMPPRIAAEPARELELLRVLRRALEERIEEALALLDALDGDPDFEPTMGQLMPGQVDEAEGLTAFLHHDDEPSLGWPEGSTQIPLPESGEGRQRRPAGLDGRRCAHGAWDLEDGDDTGIVDRAALDMIEAPGRWAA